MDLIDMTLEERHEMMRKRHAYLCAFAEPYGSLDEFAGDKDEWLAVSGIELTRNEEYISLYMPLGYDEYETYHIVPGGKGHLAVSHAVWWRHPHCFNQLLDIFSLEEVEEEDIPILI